MLLGCLWDFVHYIWPQLCAIRQLGEYFGIQSSNVACSTLKPSFLGLYFGFKGIVCATLTLLKHTLLAITETLALLNCEFSHFKHFKTLNLKSSELKLFGRFVVAKQLSFATTSC